MAARYWVGGTASWDAVPALKWALVSGGVGGQAVPTAADDVFFDAASGVVTCTVAAASVCKSLNFTGFTGTFAGTFGLTISGSLTLGAGMTRTYTGAILFNATTPQTITTNAKALANALTFNGVGGTWTLQDALNNGSSTITLTAGSLLTNGKTVTCGSLSSAGAVLRTLNITNSTINYTSLNFGAGTNLTFVSAGSTVSFASNNAGSIFTGGGKTFNIATFIYTGDNNTATIAGNNTFATLTLNSGAFKINTFAFSGNQTVTGTFTANGNSLINRLFVTSDITGTARTITAAAVVINNVDFMDITAAGVSSPWNGAATSVGDAQGNTNITFTPATTRYWVGNSGTWSSTTEWATASGGATGASVPLCHDDVVFDANSFTSAGRSAIADMPRLGKNISWVGVLNTPGWTRNTSGGNSIFGNLTLVPGMTLSGSQVTTFRGRGAQTFTSGGLTDLSGITIDAPGGSLALQDNYTNNVQTVTLTKGTFNANNFNVTIGIFSSSNAFVRTITMGSGTWNLTSTAAVTVWNAATSTNLTVAPNTSTIKIVGSTVNARTFAGGGIATYNNIWFSNGTPNGFLNITGSNTFNDFKCDTGPQTIRFTAATTTTVSTFTVNGLALNLITIGSITAANHNLVKVGGGTITCDYLSISRSQASPINTWYATNSTDGGNNTGWTFGSPGGTRSPGGGVAYSSGTSY